MKKSSLLPELSLMVAFIIGSQTTNTAEAAAVMQLKGKIVSFNADEVQLETAKSVYTIDRKSLTKPESDGITRSEVQATLSVPMSGIKNVQSRSKKEK